MITSMLTRPKEARRNLRHLRPREDLEELFGFVEVVATAARPYRPSSLLDP